MKVACTGPKGNIGSTLVNRGAIPIYSDIRDVDKLRREIKKISPDIIVNTASKSSPDWCEQNGDEVYMINTFGIVNLHNAAPDIPIVALSTDHIYYGSRKFIWGIGITKPGPYKEADLAYPINYYGLTKMAMELVALEFDNVKVVRTSNCFWREDPRITYYIDKLYDDSKVPVPTFQKRSFMHREHFADSLEYYCEHFDQMPRILHISGSRTISWYDFVKAFADEVGIPQSLSKKLTKKQFETEKFIAKRPKVAGLDVSLSAKVGLPQFDYLDGLEKIMGL